MHGIRPEQVAEVMEALEGKREKDELGIEEHAVELTDEEMENYVPLSVDETQAAIDQMRRFGLSVREIPG